jgi:hypothetical protein
MSLCPAITTIGPASRSSSLDPFLPHRPIVLRSTCLTCGTFGSLMVACGSWLAFKPTVDRGTGAVFNEVLVARDIQLILSSHTQDSSTKRVISQGHYVQTISDYLGMPVRYHKASRSHPLCLVNVFRRLSAAVMARTYASASALLWWGGQGAGRWRRACAPKTLVELPASS